MADKPQKFGRYDLVKRIARGGMAEIYFAIERGIEGVNRHVVVKRVLPHMTELEDFITMFMDEARVAARLSHPNIAHIYNFFDISPSIADASEIEKMQTVHQWAFGKNTDSKKALKKLVDLELKIGRSAIGSNKLNQLWNWIKIRELT